MAKLRRKVGGPTGYGVTAQEAAKVKAFNEDVRVVQGVRATLVPGTNEAITIKLSAPGKRLLGITVIPELNGDLSQCVCVLSVNNYTPLSNAALVPLNPNYTQGMIFFPTPAPLGGQDTISLLVTKNNAVSVNVIVNAFYLPR
jgi:hypothetical protein